MRLAKRVGYTAVVTLLENWIEEHP
jgi:hypothetical protein